MGCTGLGDGYAWNGELKYREQEMRCSFTKLYGSDDRSQAQGNKWERLNRGFVEVGQRRSWSRAIAVTLADPAERCMGLMKMQRLDWQRLASLDSVSPMQRTQS